MTAGDSPLHPPQIPHQDLSLQKRSQDSGTARQILPPALPLTRGPLGTTSLCSFRKANALMAGKQACLADISKVNASAAHVASEHTPSALGREGPPRSRGPMTMLQEHRRLLSLEPRPHSHCISSCLSPTT